MIGELARNGIVAGNGEQAVVFTEFADTAVWLVDRFRTSGFTAELYSGPVLTCECEEKEEAVYPCRSCRPADGKHTPPDREHLHIQG